MRNLCSTSLTTWLNFSGVSGASTEAKLPPEVTAKALELRSELPDLELNELAEFKDGLLGLADSNSLVDSVSAIASIVTSIVVVLSTGDTREGDDGVISAQRFSVSPNL